MGSGLWPLDGMVELGRMGWEGWVGKDGLGRVELGRVELGRVELGRVDWEGWVGKGAELVPEVLFVEGDFVFGEEGAEFVLECVLLVVLFLRRDVLLQGGEVGWSYGKDAVATLPGEVCEVGGLDLEPHRGGGFELFHEFCHGEGARESDGEMEVVFDAADEETFAVEVACDRGDVGVEFWEDGGFEERGAVFGGEDDVDEDEREGLGHGGWLGRAFSPLLCVTMVP
jgi:hypothetical protein